MPYAVIEIPDFRLQAVLRTTAKEAFEPAALVDPAEARPVVLELNELAQAAGVQRGMAPPQAFARCRELALKARSPEAEHAAAAALRECAFAFSPRVEATAAGVCTLDLQGFRDLDYDRLGEKILVRLRQLGFAGRVGIAEQPGLALHAARSARPFRRVTDSLEFLAALPVESLEPPPEDLEILKRWGIHTVGAFTALGREALAERLGPAALEWYERALAIEPRPLRLAAPPESFEEGYYFDHEVHATPPVLARVRQFLEQITARLDLLDLAAGELVLRLRFTNGTESVRPFRIPAPTRDLETLFRVVHTHLEHLRTDHAVTAVWLTARACRPWNEQLGLFESSVRDPQRFAETVARLTALLGADRVGTPVPASTRRPDALRLEAAGPAGATNEPEPAGAPSPLPEPAYGPCLRRFRPPRSASVVVRARRPERFEAGAIREPVARAHGPWLSSGEWWDRRAWDREEWDVEAGDGTVYRLFRENDQWFVEGVYD